MNKKPIHENISFCDATYKALRMDENTLIVILNSWDENEIHLSFQSTIQFVYKLGDIVEGVYMINGEPEFLREAVSLEYEKIPQIHQFYLFQITDIYDFPFIEVVAKGSSVIVKKRI